MRSKLDVRNSRSKARGKVKSPKGGKALQRLLNYLEERDPKLIPETVPVAVPVASQPKVGTIRAALKARTPKATTRARTARVRTRGGRAPAASKAFASALSRAAAKMPKRRARALRAGAKARTKKMARAAVPSGIGSTGWTEIGPNLIPKGQTYGTNRVDVIGRVSSVAVDPSNAKHLLCGSANGGIWESANGGTTWAPRTDQMPTLAIGAVTFDPHDSTRVYAGSGEGNFYASLGAGVYRSNDGGTTWNVLATTPLVGVGFYDLVVDPIDRKTLYAATSNGFYVSTNSGASWSLKRNVKCWDVTVHPSGGTVEVLAAFADGLFTSMNAGNSFASVPLPSAPASWTRLSVDRVAAFPDVAYVFGASNATAHLWRRSGTSWTKITSLPAGMNVTQAWYDWYVAASPTDKKEVYLGAIDGYRGRLTGSSWQWKNITTNGGNSIHPDQHCLAFAPNDSKVLFAGNDGGLYRSNNRGNQWTALNAGLGITEVEYLASDPTTAQWLMAGTQDNGTIRYKGVTTWDHIADGDGGDCAVNQLDPDEVYHSFYNVSLERSDDKGDSWTWLAPPQVPSLFYPPVEVSGATVAIGGASLVITRTGGGPPWTTVSLGLPSGDGASAMRAIDANTFLIGTVGGRMLKAAWNGTVWKVTNLASPAPRYISCIAIDPSNPLRIWVTLSQVGGGHVFRSDNSGTSWTDCSAGLPPIPMNAVVVDPADHNRLWVAADVGVYQTLNLGSSWNPFSAGLPNAMAADLFFHKQDRVLFCGTRNRGVWAIQVP